MTNYQDRKDIDELYNKVWDAESNQLKLVSYDELKELEDKVQDLQSKVKDVENNIVTFAEIEDYINVMEEAESTKTITVTVKWMDSNDNDNIRPPTFPVTVNNGAYDTTLLLNDSNAWSDSLIIPTDVTPKFSCVAPSEYTSELIGYGDFYVIELTHKLRTITVPFEFKIVSDEFELVNVTVRLKKNNSQYKTEYLNVSDGFDWDFDNLPYYDDGVKNQYSITVDELSNYDIAVTGTMDEKFTVTLTKKTGTLIINMYYDIVGSDYENDIYGMQFTVARAGGGASVIGYGDFENVGTHWRYIKTVDVGTYTVTNNNAYHLIRDCVLWDDYMASFSSEIEENEPTTFNFYCNYTNPDYGEEELDAITKDVTVRAVWDDSDNTEGFRPSSVDLTLTDYGGDVIDVCTVTAEDDWSHTFTDMSMYRNDELIDYRVEGEDIANYNTSIQLYDVAYSRTVATISKQLIIEFNDTGHEDERPSYIDAVIGGGRVRLTPTGEWTATAVLQKYADGQEISYSWTTSEVSHYILENMVTDGNITTATYKYFNRPL